MNEVDIVDYMNDLIEAFLQGDYELSYVFNVKTEEVLLDAPESVTGEQEIEWDEEEVVEYLRIVPQITSTEAYNLMVQFAKQQSTEIASQLLDVLNGKKPFRSFKDKLSEQGIGDKWYEFENDYARKRMLEWMEQVQEK